MARTKSKRDEKKTRCAIYTRKSTEDGLELEFNSLDAQREAAEAFIASQKNEGWTCVPDRYDDGGFSGGNVDRPGLQRLLSDIEAGKIDCVVVYKVDRLSRSLLDFARMMEVFDNHNVSFVSVTQQFNTTHSMGRLTLNILLSFAQFEREIIGERIRDKIAAQRRKGKWTGGIPVLGYDVDRSGPSPRLVVNVEEAARVRQIFDLYRSLGSLLPVVEELAERGWCNKEWKTRRGNPKGGNPFDKGLLYALLTNPIYVGRVRHKDDVFDGEHEPIVEEGVFQEVQNRLLHNSRSGGVNVRNMHGALLKGRLFCKACDRTMVHTFTNRGNKRYRYYTCTGMISKGRKSCPTRSLPASEIEAAVLDQIRDIGDDADLRKSILEQAQAQIETELDVVRSEEAALLAEHKRHNAEVGKAVGKSQQTADERAHTADLHDRMRRIEARLRELAAEIAVVENEKIGRSDVAAAFSDFDTVWNALCPREQGQLLALLVARVEFDERDSSLTVGFHPSGIKALLNKQRGDAA